MRPLIVSFVCTTIMLKRLRTNLNPHRSLPDVVGVTGPSNRHPQRSAANRVFYVKELMLTIFECFDPFVKEDHNALLAAMLTCRTWADFACSVMWREATCAKLLPLIPITRPLPSIETNVRNSGGISLVSRHSI